MVALGSLMPAITNQIIDNSVERSVVLLSSTEDQEHFSAWQSPDQEEPFMLEKFYFFNLSHSSQEQLLGGGKPILDEIGPYTVRRFKYRELTRFDDGIGEVLYTEMEYADWDSAHSGPGLLPSDVVTTINIPFQTMMNDLTPECVALSYVVRCDKN